jgi:hypothetical protein
MDGGRPLKQSWVTAREAARMQAEISSWRAV